MTPGPWRALYASDLQAVYAQWLVPAAFLLFLLRDLRRRPPWTAVEPAASRFLRAYALVFTLETIVDPFAGGPLLRWLGLADGPIATAVMFLFVLLGDFRVFVLIFALMAIHARRPLRGALAEAALWTFVVPVTTLVVHSGLTALYGPLPEQALWLIYETGFVVLVLVLRRVVVVRRVAEPALRRYLATVLAYVGVYYGLWALADALIVATGADAAWALRMVPNQLYYALFVPFVYALGFARRNAATSRSAQASR